MNALRKETQRRERIKISSLFRSNLIESIRLGLEGFLTKARAKAVRAVRGKGRKCTHTHTLLR
jgi:hypothetical protein